MPLPADWVSVVVLSALLAMLAGVCALVAEPARFINWMRANPWRAGALFLSALLLLGAASFQLAGGGLGAVLRSENPDKIRAYLKNHRVEPEKLRKFLYQELKAGRVQVAEAMLEAYGELDQTAGEQQTTLLAEGVVFFPKESVRLLLEKGADPKVPDRFVRSPALRLVLYRLPNFSSEGEDGMIELLGLLQKGGADLKQHAEDGETPLQAAEANRLQKVSEFLQACGS